MLYLIPAVGGADMCATASCLAQGQVLNCIASIVAEVSVSTFACNIAFATPLQAFLRSPTARSRQAILRSAGSGYSGGTNAFGDNQLEVSFDDLLRMS